MILRLRIALVLVFLGLLSGCDDFGLCGNSIQGKGVANSSGRVVAVVSGRDCGATSSGVYEIYLLPRDDEKIRDEYLILRADRVVGLNFQWKSERNLLISYDKARIFHYQNFWQSRYLDEFRYQIDISLLDLENSKNKGGL